MLVECIVIAGLIGAVILMSLKTNKKDAALEMVPLLFVPLMYIAAHFAAEPFAGLLPMNGFAVYTALIVIAAILSAVFIGFFANRLKTKATKVVYTVMCMTFDFVFTAVLIYNIFVTLF